MNGETQVMVTDVVIFPVQEREVAEGKNRPARENRTAEIFQANGNKEPRFARLKKSLRKRSANIL